MRKLTKAAALLGLAVTITTFAEPANAWTWSWPGSQATKSPTTLPPAKPAAAKPRPAAAKAAPAAYHPRPAAKPAVVRHAAKTHKVTVARILYPRAFSSPVEAYSRSIIVGDVIAIPTEKADRVIIICEGLHPDKVSNPSEVYDKLGWEGEVLFTFKRDPNLDLDKVQFTPLLTAAHAGIIKGKVTVYSSQDDLTGTTQPFTFYVKDRESEQQAAAPTPEPTIAPTPAPWPTPPIPIPPTPAPTPQPTPTPVSKPAWHLGVDINQGTSNVGGLGDENTRYTATLEHRWHDKHGFVSLMGRLGGTPDGINTLLPVKADDPLLQPSVNIGVQSDQDMASVGIGLNIETYIGKAGGVSGNPGSLILRGQKGGEWLGMSFIGHTELDWDIVDELGYTAGFKWSPKPTGWGVLVDVNGKIKAGKSPYFQPRAGASYRFDKNSEASLLLGWNADKQNSPSIGANYQTQF